MARTAVILGGGGFIGRVTTQRLIECGWDVTVASLGAPGLTNEMGQLGAKLTLYDRADTRALLHSVGAGVDAFIDIIPYRSDHARQLRVLDGLVGGVVALSSGATYVDEAGRQLMQGYVYDEAQTTPRAPARIAEDQPQMAPDDSSYPGGKVAYERTIRADPPAPVTILRPFAVSGPRNDGAREWWVVKRVLDRRPIVILAQRGREQFNRTSVLNLAELIRLAAESPGDRDLNAADDDPRVVIDIVRQTAAVLDWEFDEVLLAGRPCAFGLADTPWSGPANLVVDMSRARSALGFEELIGSDETLRQTIEWLVDYIRPGDWREQLPGFVRRYTDAVFDYDAEDRFVASMRSATRRCVTPAAPLSAET
jgi:nucleoside-diphosphate-sugar epimerase